MRTLTYFESDPALKPQMIEMVDIDNDDRINYSEFVKLFTEHIDM